MQIYLTQSMEKSTLKVTIFMLLSLFLAFPIFADSAYHTKGTQTIGLDLAVEHYLEWSGVKYEVPALSLEDISRSHGLRVASVYQYVGESKLKTIKQELLSLDVSDVEYMSPEEQSEFIDKFLEVVDQNKIKILLSSSGHLERKWAKELLDGLIERQVFISNSAGNYSLNVPSYSFAQKSPYVLVAGSVNSDGIYSHYAAEGPWVTIAVPDGAGAVQLPSGEHIGQAYTSGSQPILAKTLYLLLSVLGPDTPAELIKQVLKISAIKTLNAFDPLNNQGYGTLNSYLAVRIATEMVDSRCLRACDVSEIYRRLLKSHNETDLRRLALLGVKTNLSSLKDKIHVNILNPKTVKPTQTSITCTHPIDCEEVSYYRYYLRYLNTQQVYSKILDVVRGVNFTSSDQCHDAYGNSDYRFSDLSLLVAELRERGVSTKNLIINIFSRLKRCKVDAFVTFSYYLSQDQNLAKALLRLVTPEVHSSEMIRDVAKTYFNAVIPQGTRYKPLEDVLINHFKDIKRGSFSEDFLPPHYCELKLTQEQEEFLKILGGMSCG